MGSQQGTCRIVSSLPYLKTYGSTSVEPPDRRVERPRGSHPSYISWKWKRFKPPTRTGWWYTNPSEKYESQLGWLFKIYGKIKNVPNHQAEILNLDPWYPQFRWSNPQLFLLVQFRWSPQEKSFEYISSSWWPHQKNSWPPIDPIDQTWSNYIKR